MSQLSKSLEKRILDLRASIESYTSELSAYERVLELENSKPGGAEEARVAASEIEAVVSKHRPGNGRAQAGRGSQANGSAHHGNKTNLLTEIVESFGEAGATPKDVDASFNSKKITRSKNFIYNTLSYLVSQKKLSRKDGRYFAKASGGAQKKTAVTKGVKATKRRLSPEGLKRIQEALKKRWAAKKAAEAPQAKKATKKKETPA